MSDNQFGLELKNVVKRFGDVTVVQEMNLQVQQGEFIVLLGESGCGKSTTLRMIAGLEEVTKGQILINGKDVTYSEPMSRDIAMVFQSYALYPHMDVAQNMAFALKLQKIPTAEISQRVIKAAQILNIEHLLNRKPRDLSGGQRQRVAIGRAIVREPKVFLFDEPLSNLDAKLRGHMRAELAILHERLGKTTIYVTHDQVEAMTLATRVVIFNKGKIQQVGTPHEIFAWPANLFVAGFIGTPTMNFFEAVYDSKQQKLQGSNFIFPAPDWLQKLNPPPIKKLTLGIRPQDLYRCEPSESLIKLEIDVVEYLGTESQVSGHIVAEDIKYNDIPAFKHRICATLQGGSRKFLHSTLDLSFDISKLHIFDSQTEQNLNP